MTPHKLRRTLASELANAGMGLQALMALLGHVTLQMTIRSPLASSTRCIAYDEAIGVMCREFTLVPIRQGGCPGCREVARQ
ncbi:tyrosine-type recombinase/integrase [Rhodococcus opacus]